MPTINCYYKFKLKFISAIINKIEMFAPSTTNNELNHTTDNNSIRDYLRSCRLSRMLLMLVVC